MTSLGHGPAAKGRRNTDAWIIGSGRVALGVGVLVLWEFSPELFGLNPFWLSRPSLVLETAIALQAEGELLHHIGATVLETALGLTVGCIVGFAIGIVLGSVRVLRDVFEPFLLVANAFPKIAMAPLFLIWFGIGLAMKVAVAFSLVFIVMALSTYSGFRMVRPELVANARLMGAGGIQIFTKVVLPSIAPWLFAGLKVSITFALIGAVLGEFIAAQEGLGFMIDDGMASFESPLMFLGLTLLLIIVWLVNTTMEWLARRFGLERSGETAAYNT